MGNQTFGSLNGGKGTAPAIAKAATVLQTVGEAEASLGVSEIARRTALSKSTVHGLLTALVETGFLSCADATKSYSLGPRLLELGTMGREQVIRSTAESELARLSDVTGETALFGRLAVDRVVILARHQSSRPLNLSAPVGSTVPLTAGALGKAYLASIEQAAAARFLRANPPTAYTSRSLATIQDYSSAVQAARENGYAVDREEYLPGIVGVASAFAWLGVTYFVWIVGIAAAYLDEDLHRVGPEVRKTTSLIHSELEAFTHSEGTRSAS